MILVVAFNNSWARPEIIVIFWLDDGPPLGKWSWGWNRQLSNPLMIAFRFTKRGDESVRNAFGKPAYRHQAREIPHVEKDYGCLPEIRSLSYIKERYGEKDLLLQ